MLGPTGDLGFLASYIAEVVAFDLSEPGMELFDQAFQCCFKLLLLLSNPVTGASTRVITPKKQTCRC